MVKAEEDGAEFDLPTGANPLSTCVQLIVNVKVIGSSAKAVKVGNTGGVLQKGSQISQGSWKYSKSPEKRTCRFKGWCLV